MNQATESHTMEEMVDKGFFEKLFSFMGENYDLIFTVRKTDQLLTIAILPRMLSADSKLAFAPINLTDTPHVLDSDFFDKLSGTLTTTKSVMLQIKGYEESLLKAKAEAQKEASKSATPASKTSNIASKTPENKPSQPDLFTSLATSSTDSSIQPKTL